MYFVKEDIFFIVCVFIDLQKLFDVSITFLNPFVSIQQQMERRLVFHRVRYNGNLFSVQLSFSKPEFVFSQILENSLKIIWKLILKGIWVRGWGKMASCRARVSEPGRFRAGDAELIR